MSRNAPEKTMTTKEARIACIIACIDTKLEEGLINATVASVESIHALTFEKVKQENEQDTDSGIFLEKGLMEKDGNL